MRNAPDKAGGMKHWMLIGAAIIIAGVVITRSFLSPTQTLPPATSPATPSSTLPAEG